MLGIMGSFCERAQGILWGLYGKYLWVPKLGNNMENIGVIYIGSVQEVLMWAQDSLWACVGIFL